MKLFGEMFDFIERHPTQLVTLLGLAYLHFTWVEEHLVVKRYPVSLYSILLTKDIAVTKKANFFRRRTILLLNFAHERVLNFLAELEASSTRVPSAPLITTLLRALMQHKIPLPIVTQKAHRYPNHSVHKI